VNNENRFGLWISVLNNAAYKYYNKVLKPYSIGPGGQAYLVALQPGESITQDTLSKRLYRDKANVARALKLLEDTGYVRREQSTIDRREQLVRLTPLGIQVRYEVENKMREWVEALHSQVPQDQWDTMVSVIERIARFAEEFVSADVECA
jgi:DNA-binding MarR family transcriptional regulator